MVVVVLISIGTFFRFYLVSSVGERVSADIRLSVFNHVHNFILELLETNGSATHVAHHNRHNSASKHYWFVVFMAMRSALMCIGAIIMLFATNIKLTLIVIASVPFILIPILVYGRRVRALSRQRFDVRRGLLCRRSD